MSQVELSGNRSNKHKVSPDPSSNFSDAMVIQQIRDGDVDAYALLMRRYNQRLYRIARSILKNDAEAIDVVQEAHIKAFTKLDEFRGLDGFSAWLGAITRNEALMQRRKHQKEALMLEDNLEFFETPADDSNIAKVPANHPEKSLATSQLKALMNQYIDNLPINFRTVFVLRAIEQLTVRETAVVLDIKEETVKTRFFRAKRLLREQIQSELETEGLQIYEFGGHHCDLIVHNVMQRIHNV